MKVLLTLSFLAVLSQGRIIAKHQIKLVSSNGIPGIDITMPDGSEDSLHLKHAIDESTCAFRGHLRNDPQACVAVTGCPGQDPLEITIAGKTGGLFKLGLDGITEDATNADPRVVKFDREDPIGDGGEDHDIDENMSKPMPSIPDGPMDRDAVADKFWSKMPSTMLLRIKPHYDESALAWKGGDHDKVKTYIQYAMTHAQVPYCHASLGVKVKLALAGEPVYHKGVTWNPTTAMQQPYDYDAETDLHWYLSYSPGANPGGKAFALGVVCNPTYKLKGNQMSMFGFDDDKWTGQIMAHEIGHALGMGHDVEVNPLNDYEKKLATNHLKRGCTFQGQMSYITDGNYPPLEWSICSSTDFHYYYDYIKWFHGWCLKEAPDACQ